MTDAYAQAGVDYEKIDPFKRKAIAAALRTASKNELGWSRGESAYVTQISTHHVLGIVEEGLGTKNLVADAMRPITNRTHYDTIAQDTVAMIVNDLATLGIPPEVVTMHVAAGNDAWFADEERADDLTRGWAEACLKIGATWGCGESPTLNGLIHPETALLSGSAVGRTHILNLLEPNGIQDEDVILVLPSNGIHANGLSLARKIAAKLPDGYRTQLPDGRMYGEVLLDPTYLYSSIVPTIQKRLDIDSRRSIHYAVNITGHGWRKLMRASQAFEYTVWHIDKVPSLFDFMQAHADMSDEDMYATFNMGGGFALFVSRYLADDVLRVLKEEHFMTPCAVGKIRKSNTRRVIVERADKPTIMFEQDSLNVR